MTVDYTTGATAEKLFITFTAMVQNNAAAGGWLIININGTDIIADGSWYPGGAGVWAVATNTFPFNAAASTTYTIKMRYKVSSGTFTCIRSAAYNLARISGFAVSNA